MQTEINIQTSKVVAANKLIEDIKFEKSAMNEKINRAEKDLEAILDVISVFLSNAKGPHLLRHFAGHLKIALIQALGNSQNRLSTASPNAGCVS